MIYQTHSTNKKLKQSISILGAMALAAGFAGQARADVDYQISGPTLDTVGVSYNFNNNNNPQTSVDVLAGGIGITATTPTAGTGAPSYYVSVCTDFLDTLYLGATYKYANPAGIPDANYTPDPTQVAGGLNKAGNLFAANSGLLTKNSDDAAALQLAVWTLLYDSSFTIHQNGTVTGSEFSVTTADSTTLSELDALLTESGTLSSTSTSTELLVPDPENGSNNGNNQSDAPQALLFAPVPEASTVLSGSLLLLSFGVCSLKSFGKFRA